jgi:hypothetical protein
MIPLTPHSSPVSKPCVRPVNGVQASGIEDDRPKPIETGDAANDHGHWAGLARFEDRDKLGPANASRLICGEQANVGHFVVWKLELLFAWITRVCQNFVGLEVNRWNACCWCLRERCLLSNRFDVLCNAEF